MNPVAVFLCLVGLTACAGSRRPVEPSLVPAVDAPAPQPLVWTKLEAAPHLAGNQDDLWCFDGERCVAVNSAGAIWKTGDGGVTWEQTVDQPGTFFRAVAFLDDEVGIVSNLGVGLSPAVTDTRVLFRTTDGGASWTPVDGVPADISGICNLHPVDARTMWASGRVGGPSWVGSTEDAGLTWNWFDVAEHLEQVIDLEFDSPATGLVIGSMEGRGRVIRTVDAGLTWTVVWEGEREGELPWKISFPTAQTGFIGVQYRGESGETRVLRSDDGGGSWTAHAAVGRPYAVKGIGFMNDNVGWLAGENQAFGTVDGGQTWAPVEGLFAGVNRFRFPADGVGYAIGTSVWKLTPTP